MKKYAKIISAILLIAAIIMLSACGKDAELTSHPIEVTNSTGQAFNNIMIIPAGSDEISDDYLPVDGFSDGSTNALPFSGDSNQQKWDIVAKSGESTLIWSEIPLFEISSITLFYGNGETSFNAE